MSPLLLLVELVLAALTQVVPTQRAGALWGAHHAGLLDPACSAPDSISETQDTSGSDLEASSVLLSKKTNVI